MNIFATYFFHVLKQQLKKKYTHTHLVGDSEQLLTVNTRCRKYSGKGRDNKLRIREKWLSSFGCILPSTALPAPTVAHMPLQVLTANS